MRRPMVAGNWKMHGSEAANASLLAELAAPMPRYPQVMLNVKVERRFDPAADDGVREVTERAQRGFDGRGRVVLRASGTEPVIRVMVEGHDAAMVKRAAQEIATAVERAARER